MTNALSRCTNSRRYKQRHIILVYTISVHFERYMVTEKKLKEKMKNYKKKYLYYKIITIG